jgi:hypothetical protein
MYLSIPKFKKKCFDLFHHVENLTDKPYKRHIITFRGMPGGRALVNRGDSET